MNPKFDFICIIESGRAHAVRKGLYQTCCGALFPLNCREQDTVPEDRGTWCPFCTNVLLLLTAPPPEHRAVTVLRQIIQGLPISRDWLDPALEKEAREITNL